MNLFRRFFRLKKNFVLIEVQPEIPLGDEAKAAATRLGEHPGFLYLLQMLRRHKAAMVEALKICNERDLIHLQEGIKWAGWLERTVAHEVKIKEARRKEVSLSDREKDILDRSLASLEIVGT